VVFKLQQSKQGVSYAAERRKLIRSLDSLRINVAGKKSPYLKAVSFRRARIIQDLLRVGFQLPITISFTYQQTKVPAARAEVQSG